MDEVNCMFIMMMFFGMMNWMFIWFKFDGLFLYEGYVEMVIDMLENGLGGLVGLSGMKG